jgi:hypothetical protein
VVVVDDVALLVVVVPDVLLGVGAPVANRQPAPGGLKADMLMSGGGRFVSGVVGCVLGVVGCVLGVVGCVLGVVGCVLGVVESVLFVVGDVVVVVGVTCSVVVGVAAGER